MSVKKRANGRWEVRWLDGTKHRSKSFRRKVDANQFEDRVLTDLRRGDYIAPSAGKIILAAWCDEWLEGAHHLKPRSLAIYRAALAHINTTEYDEGRPPLGQLPLGKIAGTDIDRYLKARLDTGAASSTVHREYRTLKTAYRRAIKARRITRSPVEDATEPRLDSDEMIFLTVDQLERLARSFDARWRTWVLVTGWGGLRWGETVGLQVRSVDVTRGRIRVQRQMTDAGEVEEPKAHSRRWVNLPASVMAELAAHIEGKGPEDLVWTMPEGGYLRHRNFVGHVERPADKDQGIKRRPARGWFKPAAQAADLPAELRPHDLRHTAVALAIRAGAHPKAIQQRMGHKSIRVTLDTYGHLYDDMDEAVAVALDDMRGQRRHLVAV